MKYADGPSSGPPMPRSRATLQQRTASMITPAELGESHTSSLSSTLSGHVAEVAALERGCRPTCGRRATARGRDGPMCTSSVVDALVDLAGDRLRLRDLLRLQPLALEHVLEVHVAAEVQLVRAVDRDAAVLEQAGEHAVRDGGADLALDVVADDRHAGLLELRRPLGVARDEHRDGVDERDAGVEAGLRVVALRLLGADREVGHEHVGAGVAQRPARRRPARPATPRRSRGSTCRGRRASGRACTVTPSSPTSANLIVLFWLAKMALPRSRPTFVGVDVERGDELDVADVVAAEHDVHEAGHLVGRVGVLVVLEPWTRELAQLPTPAIAKRILLMGACLLWR